MTLKANRKVKAAVAGLVAASTTAGVSGTPGAAAAKPAPSTACGPTPIESGQLNDAGVVHTSSVDLSAGCQVTWSTDTSATGSAEAPPLESTSSSGGAAPAKQGADAAAAVTYGNVIHGSQTMQDIINIDIAKYRYGHDRIWDGSKTSFKSTAWWMVSSTSVSWNHPSGPPASDGFDGTSVTTANAFGHGAFHSDFLWCNFQPGQNFYLNTQLTSYKNGGYGTRFTQSRACSGTHMATASKADTKQAAW